MTLSELRTILVSYFKRINPGVTIIWKNQNAPMPEYPFIAYNIVLNGKIGHADKRISTNDSGERDVITQKNIEVEFEGFGVETYDYLENVNISLELDTNIDYLENLGLAYRTSTGVTDASFQYEETSENRYLLSLVFGYGNNSVEQTEFFDTVIAPNGAVTGY